MVVPLDRVASFVCREGTNQISHENGKRRVVVTANIRDRDIASVVNETRQRVQITVKLPAGYWLVWGGQFENLMMARQRLFLVFPVCFLLLFFLFLCPLRSAPYPL